jgi:hypothetical protein
MSTYYVDFSGWCEAEAKFWEYVYDDVPLPHHVYNLEGVEEKTD